MGAGSVHQPQQKAGSMGIIMPLYTIGVVAFFVYTIMKVSAFFTAVVFINTIWWIFHVTQFVHILWNPGIFNWSTDAQYFVYFDRDTVGDEKR